MNRQRTTFGWPTGSPVRRDSFGGRTAGFDAASFGMRATSGARTTNAFGRRESAASGLSSGTRATAEEWRARARTTAPPFGVGCWVAKTPFGEVTRPASKPIAFGRSGPMRGLPSGGSTCVRAALRGGWDAAEAPLSGGAGATMRSIPAAPFGAPQGRWRNAATLGSQAPAPAATDLRVWRPASTPEPDKAETLCLPLDVRVVGTPAGFTRRRNAQLVWAARKRAAASERVDPKPMGASSGAQRKRCVAATSSSVEQSPEVGAVRSASWKHESGRTSNDERARQPVKATTPKGSRKGARTRTVP